MIQDPKILMQRLKDLIMESASINSLPEDKKKETVNRMFSSTPEQMQELVKILENEAVEMAKLDEEERKKIEEVESLLKEVEETEKELKTELRKEAETTAGKEESSEQQKLLDELNNI